MEARRFCAFARAQKSCCSCGRHVTWLTTVAVARLRQTTAAATKLILATCTSLRLNFANANKTHQVAKLRARASQVRNGSLLGRQVARIWNARARARIPRGRSICGHCVRVCVIAMQIALARAVNWIPLRAIIDSGASVAACVCQRVRMQTIVFRSSPPAESGAEREQTTTTSFEHSKCGSSQDRSMQIRREAKSAHLLLLLLLLLS